MMKRLAFGLVIGLVLAGAAKAQTAENRCGWFANPSPANAWLTDKDGEWTIATQGGHQADGDWPGDFPKGQWVSLGRSYGYGCACMKVAIDKSKKRVVRILDAKPRPLIACRGDKALAKGEDKLK